MNGLALRDILWEVIFHRGNLCVDAEVGHARQYLCKSPPGAAAPQLYN